MCKILIALALATSPVFAHEGGTHLKGTVLSAAADQLTVKSADGHETTLTVTEKTRFMRGSAPASLAEVKKGERVVIHARKAGSGLEAAEVHLGAHPAKHAH